jgi:hypothetical protein
MRALYTMDVYETTLTLKEPLGRRGNASTCTWNASGSNLGPTTLLKLRHDHFHPYPVQFTIIESLDAT